MESSKQVACGNCNLHDSSFFIYEILDQFSCRFFLRQVSHPFTTKGAAIHAMGSTDRPHNSGNETWPVGYISWYILVGYIYIYMNPHGWYIHLSHDLSLPPRASQTWESQLVSAKERSIRSCLQGCHADSLPRDLEFLWISSRSAMLSRMILSDAIPVDSGKVCSKTSIDESGKVF